MRFDARNSSYRGNRPTYTQTHTHTHTQTDRTDYNTLRRSLSNQWLKWYWQRELCKVGPAGSWAGRAYCIAKGLNQNKGANYPTDHSTLVTGNYVINCTDALQFCSFHVICNYYFRCFTGIFFPENTPEWGRSLERNHLNIVDLPFLSLNQ